MEDMPPGFRFFPTESELVEFYLKNKLDGQRQDLNQHMDRVIPVVDIYEYNPWDLPQFSAYLCHKDPEQWFFFIPRQESEARGGRPRRLTTTGYWKATGSPGFVYSSVDSRPIGLKRTMVFYNGRAPSGRKTEWKMNEYKAIDGEASSSTPSGALPSLRQDFSLCRIYKKSKCLRSFDRRPPAPRVIINELPNAHQQRQSSRSAPAILPHQSGQTAAETNAISSPESSSSGDHGINNAPSQTGETGICCSSMVVDDDSLWDMDALWD